MKAAAIILAITVAGGPGQLGAQPAPGVVSSERTSVDLTVYNQNLSLVREERTLTLTKGLNHVVLPDVPATIDATSLHFSSITDPSSVTILEQNYQYDLVNQATLMEKYIGKDVEFIRWNEEAKKEYTVTGTLLSSSYGLIAEIDGKVEINPTGRLVLPRLPEGLILKPQLDWLMNSTREGVHKAEVSYLAGQLSWASDYVVLLDKDDAKLDLTGWVTLVNHSGTSFKNAGLKLVAGDVNMVRPELNGGLRIMKNAVRDEEAAPQFKQTDLFEYKLYTLQRRTDVDNNETKQVELVSGTAIPAKKILVYDGLEGQWQMYFDNPSYRAQSTFGQQSNTKVGVFVVFKNDKKSGLGLPLPKGKVRVYKKDQDGKEQFVGEDEIDHTPKDEELRLYLGNAFDVVGDRVQKDFRTVVPGHVIEETIEIRVRNHKDGPAEVQVFEHPWRWSQWEVTVSSESWEKKDQSTLIFPLTLKKDEERTVRYTIRYTW